MGSKNTNSSLIQHYLEGTLSPGEMHAFEKQVLEDPFLADALEGYSKSGVPPAHQLSILQRQLETRIALQSEDKNNFYFSWQRLSVAAAAGLLFITAGILFWMKPGLPGHVKNKAEVTLGTKSQTVFTPLPSKPAASGIEPIARAADPAAKVRTRALTIEQPEAPETASLRAVPQPRTLSAAFDTTKASKDDIPTVKDNAKNDFQDFVGSYQQNNKDLIIEPKTVKTGEPAEEKVTRVGSLQEYKSYLENKLRNYTSFRNFNGSIQLEFTPLQGKASDLKIKGSAGRDMDDEIRKVIEDGPQLYFSTEGRKPTVEKVKLEFKNISSRQ